MAQAINIIHPESAIMSRDDNTIFRFNGNDWIENKNIKLHRYCNVLFEDLDLNPDDYTYDDYFEFSATYTNDCIQSELLTDTSVWNKENVSVTQSEDFFSFPDNKNPAFLMKMLNLEKESPYSLGQQFRAKLGKYYLFSMFVKNVTSTTHSKIAITIKNNSCNIILSAPADLAHTIWHDDRADLNIEYVDGKTYEIIQDCNLFTNTHAHIERIYKNDEYYYRLSIGFKVVNNTILTAGLNLLNDSGKYSFTSIASSIRFYTSGAQMEISDFYTEKTAPYMITYDKPVQNIVTTALYGIRVINDEQVFKLLENNKIHYIEEYTESNNRGTRKLLSEKPPITDYYDGDLAVVQSVVSFGTSTLTNKKTYPKWASNTYYKAGDYVLYLNNLYKCKTTHTSTRYFTNNILNWDIIIDAVGLGFSKDDSLPNNCIYYDSENRVYRIKKTTESGDQWLLLNYQGSQVRIEALIKALMFGQGVFATWDEQEHDWFKPSTWNKESCVNSKYSHGYNTNGNYNFFKLRKISSVL